MNVLFITTEGFPNGMAQTNRIRSLAKILSEQEIEVKVLIARPTERKNSQVNFERKGSIDNISFLYVTKKILWPSNKIKKLLVTIYSIILTCIYLYKNKSRNDIIIISNPRELIDCLFKFSCPNQKFILAVDEYPTFERVKKIDYNIQKFMSKFAYRCYDGFIVMTNVLIKYYKNIAKKNAPFIHIPMTVECDRFIKDKIKSPIKQDYIAYCGNLGHNQKDGIPILMEAFSKVKHSFEDLKLVIIGGSKPSEEKMILDKLKSLAVKLNIFKDVIFTGKIHRDEIPKYLNNARVLALARPKSIQAEGGFPTKLGEYLSTGRPVVITKVGEIPNYLEHGENAYLAEPNNVEDFAKKLKYVLQNRKVSDNVGNNGQKLALNVFDYKNQSKKLFHFLSNLKN